MAPPSWAKNAMEMKWAGALFEDDTETSSTMRGQLFYIVNAAIWTYCFSWSLRTLLKDIFGVAPLPKFLVFPQVEVKVFLGITTGLLDGGMTTLLNGGVAYGWRFIGFLCESRHPALTMR